MPDGPVVLNNTPLVALTVLGRLDLLRDLFGEVLIPESVRDDSWLWMWPSDAKPSRTLYGFGLFLWLTHGEPFPTPASTWAKQRFWHWPKSARRRFW